MALAAPVSPGPSGSNATCTDLFRKSGAHSTLKLAAPGTPTEETLFKQGQRIDDAFAEIICPGSPSSKREL